MRERMQKYLANIDRLLKTEPEETDWETEIQKHLIQMGFFMHERLIHLIVTVLVAILTVAAILFAVTSPSIGMLILIVALMCLLIPYILHYYLLENGVQAMYRQYDEMLARKEGKNPADAEPAEEAKECTTKEEAGNEEPEPEAENGNRETETESDGKAEAESKRVAETESTKAETGSSKSRGGKRSKGRK